MHQQMAHAGPKASRRDWIGLAVIAIPCLIYSMDLTVLYLAVPQITADLKPSSSRAAVDRRHLRLHGCRRAGDDGDARRSRRSPPRAADRRGRLWRHVGAGRHVDECRDADCRARAAGPRRRGASAIDALAHPQHVPRRRRARLRHRRVGRQLLRRRRHRSRWSAACCSTTSPGIRCS